MLEPALFALVGELRRVGRNLLPAGGTAEVTLTRTDSGVDLLLEAARLPDLAALEGLARFAENCDLARIVWRSPGEEILVVERRSVRVVLSEVAVPFPPGGFLQASAAAEAILVEEALPASGRAGRCSTSLLASAPSPSPWPAPARFMPSKATSTPLSRLLAAQPAGRVLRSSSAISPVTRCRPRRSPPMPPRYSTAALRRSSAGGGTGDLDD